MIFAALIVTLTCWLTGCPDPLGEWAPGLDPARLAHETRSAATTPRDAPLEASYETAGPTTQDPETGIWDLLAECESGGNWSINTGNGYYGGIQFDLRSWEWAGGTGFPHHATRAEQIRRGERLLELRALAGLEPWAGWPACARKLGLR